MLTLRGSALAAAPRGETTYGEVLRATHVDTVRGPRCERMLGLLHARSRRAPHPS